MPIVFIYETLEGARNDTGFSAVGFIASVSSRIRSMHRYYYLVTNEHVVRDFEIVIIRINGVLGFKFLSIPKTKFQTDRKLDLAIVALPEDSETSFLSISEDASITPEKINKLKIGYGTDVFMVSRIVRSGVNYLKRNLAVLRFGNIALPPAFEEPFYLVEMRSIAGHSGSPVLAYPTPFIFGTPRNKEEDFAPILLGINRGHLEETTEIVREQNWQLLKHPYFRSITNMAMSQVVPAWHIFEMLNGKKFKTQRQKADGKLVPAINMVEDERTRKFFDVPKGKKKAIGADASVVVSDITPEEKELWKRLLQSASDKSKPEP